MTINFQIGIMGGTGLDDLDILEDRKEKRVHTPFGEVNNVFVFLIRFCIAF